MVVDELLVMVKASREDNDHPWRSTSMPDGVDLPMSRVCCIVEWWSLFKILLEHDHRLCILVPNMEVEVNDSGRGVSQYSALFVASVPR